MNRSLPLFSDRGIGIIIILFTFCFTSKGNANHISLISFAQNSVTNCVGGDVEPPTASNPATINAECIVPPPDPEVVTDEADNCPGEITVAFVSDVSDNMTCPETITRTYSVSDASGNSIQVFQTIILNDLTDPVITCPPNLSTEAGNDTSPATTGLAVAVDNCNPDEDVLFLDNYSGGNCPVIQVIQRTWASVDDCGNTSICSQTISITDTTPPSVTCPVDITIEWGSSISPDDTGFASATDTGDPDPEITFSDNEIITGTCPEIRILERTWTATDDCGNTAICLQIITGTDNTPPIIICPADIDIEWGDSDQPSNTGQATVSDNADQDVDLVFADSVITSTTCPLVYTIERTWMATDDCGLTATCLQIINVNDTTPPDISCPTTPGGPVEVNETEPNNSPQDAGVVQLTNESIISGAIGPVVSDPSDHWVIQDGYSGELTLQFNFSLHPVTIAALTWYADQARTIEISSESILPFDPPLTYNMDSNLFYSVVIQNPLASGQGYEISVTGPAFPIIPGSTVLECPAGFNTLPVSVNIPQDPIIDPSVTGMPVATDNYGISSIGYQDVIIGPDPANCPDVFTVERLWTAIDSCGLISTCIETFVFTDTTDPEITCPPDISVPYGSDTQPSASGNPVFSDNCDPALNMVFSDNITVTGSCPVVEIIERTFVVGDDCGNAASCIQTISLTDLDNPVIICPPDLVIDCGEDDSPDSTGWATATDDLDPDLLISYSDNIIITSTCPVIQQIERTWSATDDCGNKADCIQLIEIQDITRPVITCPSDIVLECGQASDPSSTGFATATEECSVFQITHTDNFSASCGDAGTITRIWTVTDECGNSDTCTQLITITDSTPPSIVCPASLTVECGTSVDPADTGTATGNDNCGLTQFSFSDSIDITCGQAGTLSRIWTATDDCGNSTNCIQILTIVDTTPPGLACPPDVTVECGDPTGPVATGQPTGMDNCGTVQFGFSDGFNPGCGQTSVISRTWTATDNCGNTSTSCIQTISLEDTTPPSLNCPPDITIECQDDTSPSNTGNPTVSDACGNAVLAFTDVTSPGCGQTEVITRTWTAMDNCGNTVSCIQLITAEDSTPPIIACPPDVTIECGEAVDPDQTGSASSLDGCGSVSLIFSDVVVAGSCGLTEEISRTWIAIDECNNVAQCTQTISVTDSTPPLVSCNDLTINLDNQGMAVISIEEVEASSSDNCGLVALSLSKSEFDCADTGDNTVTLNASDACGNITGCNAIITVVNPNPVIISADIVDQAGPVDADGSIDLSISAGLPPYDFNWSNGATTEDIYNLVSGNYIVAVSDQRGCLSIDTFFVDQGVLLPVEYCLTVYLQSMFNPFAIDPVPPLNTILNDLDLLPLAQPFGSIPWNYTGQESFNSQADIDDSISDWLLLRIRPENDPSQIISQQAVVLHNDGTVRTVEGNLPKFLLDPAQAYWVEIDQHNHLTISSPIPLTINPLDLQICHDFTTGFDQAYINPQINGMPMRMVNSLSGPVYCMIAGNALFADNQIDINDLNQIFIHYDESLVYVPWDINQDGYVEINDINLIFSVYGLNAHKPY